MFISCVVSIFPPYPAFRFQMIIIYIILFIISSNVGIKTELRSNVTKYPNLISKNTFNIYIYTNIIYNLIIIILLKYKRVIIRIFI